VPRSRAAQLATEVHGLAEGEGRRVDDGTGKAVGGFQGRDLVESARARDGWRDAGHLEGLADRPLA
jgi:hypothetical protein